MMSTIMTQFWESSPATWRWTLGFFNHACNHAAYCALTYRCSEELQQEVARLACTGSQNFSLVAKAMISGSQQDDHEPASEGETDGEQAIAPR